MYAALWKILPGKFWLKLTLVSILTASVITLLMLFVFPAIDTALSVREVTVTQ